jgi:NADPH-dependent curcumin reductase CurA
VSREVHLHRYPEGAVREDDFRVVEVPRPEPGPGEVLVRNTWCSVDPGMRLQMRPAGPAGYFPSFALDAPMGGMAVGEVVASNADGFSPGDAVAHALGWREHAVVDAGSVGLGGVGTLRRVDTSIAPVETYLGVLGGPGLTAYVGLLEVAGLREGDVVWISAAAGAVGGLAAQIAKLKGHFVIGSAGSTRRCECCSRTTASTRRSTTAPARSPSSCARPRRTASTSTSTTSAASTWRPALGALRRWGRVAICGSISEYDKAEPSVGVRNLFQSVANDLTLRGFRGSSYVERRPQFEREVGAWLREGRIRADQTVVEGLERAPQAIVAAAQRPHDRQGARPDRLTTRAGGAPRRARRERAACPGTPWARAARERRRAAEEEAADRRAIWREARSGRKIAWSRA